MTPLYWRLTGALIIALVIGGIGYKVGGSHWEAKYTKLVSQDWQSKALGEEAARKRVEADLRRAQATVTNNSAVLENLTRESASIVADRDRVRELADRLLARPARSCPRVGGMPEADYRPAVAEAGEAGSDEHLAELLADTAAECRNNAAQLNSLIAEISPQLESNP